MDEVEKCCASLIFPCSHIVSFSIHFLWPLQVKHSVWRWWQTPAANPEGLDLLVTKNTRMPTRYLVLLEMCQVCVCLFSLTNVASFKGCRGDERHRTQRQDCVRGPSSEENGEAGGAEEEVWAAETREDQPLSGLQKLLVVCRNKNQLILYFNVSK